MQLKALIDAIKIPTSLPASDVYSWAKQPQKPTYTASEVGAATAQQVADLSAAIADLERAKISKTGITLGLHSDGKYYIFVDGAPVGTGFELSGNNGDVFGYVDANNTIVLNGSLADGSYSIKYETEDGKTINIGNLVLDSNVYYSITNTLTNCTNSNSATQVISGQAYTATITPKSGYELKSVTVTMGGSPVSVSSGSINIANVTGDIVITAVAEQAISYDGHNVYTEFGYTNGKRQSASNGQIKDGDGYVLSGAVPLTNLVGKTITLRSKGLTNTGGAGVWGIHSTASDTSASAAVTGTISDSSLWKNIQKTYDDSGSVIVATFEIPTTYANHYFRFSSKGSGATATLTIDKEI